MKKSLVLAMAMALGVTASAYAANPFSDVPAGHWAYDSIDKLAAAGVIDGMGDGTYQGDKTMTRYEMAQIVAKAMAKGANVDKLAAEFADELDNLGVRVANLEKKADNVKISGLVKIDNWSYMGGAGKDNKVGYGRGGDRTDAGTSRTNHKIRLRSNLSLNGKINENWNYVATIRNEQFLDNGCKGVGEEETRWRAAYVNGRVGGLKVMAGRYDWTWFEEGNVFDDRIDGIQVSYGKKVKVTAGHGQISACFTPIQTATPFQAAKDEPADKITYGIVEAQLSKAVSAHAAIYHTTLDKEKQTEFPYVDDDNNIIALGVNAKLNKNLALSAIYLHSEEIGGVGNYLKGEKASDKKNGYVVGLNYKGAKRTVPGSYGINATYYYQPRGTYIVHTMDGSNPPDFKGAKIGFRYTLAKNITAGVDYYTFKSMSSIADSRDTIFSTLQFNF